MAASIGQLEPEFKKILYRCLEDVRATKAAVYLSEEGKPYELSAQYGFPDSLRRQVKGNDPIIERLILRKASFFVNGLTSEQRFHEILFHSDSDRMLVVPLFARGQLIGFLDMRDKAQAQPFTPADIEKAKAIAKDFFELFAREQLFGQQASAAASTPEGGGGRTSLPIARILDNARQTVTRELITAPAKGRILSEAEIAPVESILPAILAAPGVLLAAFSAFGHLGNIQPVAVRSSITQEAMKKFDEKLQNWLRKQGSPVLGELTRTKMLYPFGSGGAPIQPGQLGSILSAPVNVGNVHGLVLSAGFEQSPDRETQMHLANFLHVVEHVLEYSISHHSVRLLRQRAAERLLEPDFERFPEMLDHAKRVSDLADQFAHEIGLPAWQMEDLRLAALVHDVGMRLLNYENLYRKQNLTDQEFELIRQHPVVGAAMVAESPLGSEIARIVLHHHERPDGKGYPNGLTGPQIPVASSILHLCEAFDAMTAVDSYQPRMPESTALLQISRAAGAQFDAELARRFVAMLGGVA